MSTVANEWRKACKPARGLPPESDGEIIRNSHSVSQPLVVQRILRWSLIAQRTVRPFFVVLLLPRSDLPSRVPQVLEPTHVQTFIAQPRVKTFHVSVLLRLSRLDMHQLDLPFD